jgi:hypothetical protein
VAKEDLQGRIDALKQLLELFRLERLVYICMTVAALMILLVCAAILLFKDIPNAAVVGTGLFGSSGLITFTTGRLLRMWNQAFAAILGIVEERGHELP